MTYPAPPEHWREAEALLAAAIPTFRPRPAQGEAVRLVCAALDHRQHIALDLPTGSGKGLDLDTPILTEGGWSTMGSLSVGDRIHAIDGTLTEVIMASEVKHLDCYRVTFADGATFICDSEHLWHVFDEYGETGAERRQGIRGAWRTLPVTKIAEKYDISPKSGGNQKSRFGVSTDRVLQRPHVNLPVDPYLLGWWLGNGSSYGPQITAHSADADFLLDYILSLGIPARAGLKAQGSSVTLNVSNRPNGHRLRPPLKTDLQNLGLLRNKHIPTQYLLADADQRAALLAGLLDSDGHTAGGVQGEFTNTNEDLAYGVQFLLRSLGYKASIREGRATMYGEDMGPKWRVYYSVAVDRHPYRSPRRIAQVTSKGSKQTKTNKIIHVERVESVPTRCIRVAHESHVFLAGESLTPTHNSLLSLHAAERAKGRTVISTATKALQNQLRSIDIPTLQAAGVLTRDTVVLEGRGNYACARRVDHELPRANPAAIPVLEALQAALKEKGASARRDDIPVAVPDWVWASICSDADACRALECSVKGGCAYISLRGQARAADVVVINHHVLLADAAIKSASPVSWGKKAPEEGKRARPGILGPYQNLIIDEAHALESAVESFGERRVTVRGIQALATRVSRVTGTGSAVAALADAQAALQEAIAVNPQGALIRPNPDLPPVLTEVAAGLKLAAADLRDQDDYDRAVASEILHSNCISLVERMNDIDSALRYGKDAYGLRAPSFSEGAVTSQLVDVAPWLNTNLWDHVPTVIMSGTLAVPGRRDFVSERLGLPLTKGTTMLPTVFNLAENRLVYVTPRVDSKDPKVLSARCGEADVEEIRALIEASQGRALVLFPAMTDLRYVYEELEGTISHTLLAQGVTLDSAGSAAPKRRGKGSRSKRGFATGDVPKASPAQLAERFKSDTSSVLLATRSFFEGIDVPGETCSLVIITRFPNLRPDDPLTLARRLKIDAEGGNPWISYQLPSMMLLFRQAAGRAIRRVDDRGVVAIIDPRAGTKSYGKQALLALKPSDYTDSIADVEKFLAP